MELGSRIFERHGLVPRVLGYAAPRCKGRVALFPVFACALAILSAERADAQVQATKHNTLRWIRGVCHDSLTDIGRAAIAERGKTVAEVCNCTADNMWKKFPSTYYWVQETNPYEWNKVKAEFPKVLSACILE